MVELALLLPILVFGLIGAADLGRAFAFGPFSSFGFFPESAEAIACVLATSINLPVPGCCRSVGL